MNELRGMQLGGCELLEEIGQGGMGLIYRARQVSLDRVVAMKILAEHLAHNPSFVERFQREARAIAKINHANILAVYDVGCQESHHYMIMELVDGGSLAEMLEKRGILEAGEAAELILQAARGLECAAQRNIIHRDVKPDNVMLTSQHVVKVSDFGLAKELDGTMTETQAVMGTPAYMSPEQCDGRDLDSRTDIYSLGGTFYRCVTGRLPFEADTAMSMMYRHKHVPLTPPAAVVPTLPKAISDIIVRMMAKDRNERFQTMGDVAKAIEEARQSKPAFDPGRTIPVAPPSRPAAPVGPADTGEPAEPATAEQAAEPVPAFLKSDSRVMAAPQLSPKQVADTRARCKQSAEKLRAEGKLVQAARELRRLLDVAPDDAEAQAALHDLERLISDKRLLTGEIRTMVASGHYEEAMVKWNALAAEMRDEQIAAQMERLANTVVPSLRQVAAGDEAAAAGRLEEAERLYQGAATLDPSNEKARQGIKNVERTRQRIQFLLKEGYSHRQNRDYKQAIEVWNKILAVDPDNSQAKRLIVEAHMTAAGEALTAEDFERVARHCEAVLKIEPKHDEAGRQYAEAVARRDRVAELRKQADMARGHGDLTGTIRAYKQLATLVPKSKVARDGLQSARHARSRQRSKRLLVLLVVIALLAGGWYLYQDWVALSSAETELREGRFADAIRSAERVRLILRDEAQRIIKQAVLQDVNQELAKAEKFSDLPRAVKALQRAVEVCEEGSQREVFQKQLHGYLFRDSRRLAELAESGSDWAAAYKHHNDAWRHLQQLVAAGGSERIPLAEAQQQARQAEKDREFCSLFQQGLLRQSAGDREGAKSSFLDAGRYREKSDALRAKLKELGVEPGK
jgi:tetratricopeptide (TPR) repeat protein